MSAQRAREVRRYKVLRAMYCPGGGLHGPEPTLSFWLKRFYEQVARSMWQPLTPLPDVFCRASSSRYGGVSFPLEAA